MLCVICSETLPRLGYLATVPGSSPVLVVYGMCRSELRWLNVFSEAFRVVVTLPRSLQRSLCMVRVILSAGGRMSSLKHPVWYELSRAINRAGWSDLLRYSGFWNC